MDYQRQLDIFNPGEFENMRTTIVGCGGIGSFAAIAIAKLGLNLALWDGDKVEPHNVPNQFFPHKAIGMNKAEALGRLVKSFSDVDVEVFPKMWEGETLSGVIVVAVDSMQGRRKIWEQVKSSPDVPLLVDGRIGGEFVRVIAIRPVNDAFIFDWYERTLVDDEDAVDFPCTARAVIYVGFQVAATITACIKQFLTTGKLSWHDMNYSMSDFNVAMNLAADTL